MPKPQVKRTPEFIIAEQKRDAEAAKARAQATEAQKAAAVKPVVATVPTTITGGGVPALPDNSVQRYIDEISPATVAGRLCKLSKDGAYKYTDTGEDVDVTAEYIALVPETFAGWIKFSADGEPPQRHMGLIYDGFVIPSRSSLGDMDKSLWPLGLDGAPEDPWRHMINVVLQSVATRELMTFSTASISGRNACGVLLRHYDRLRRRKGPDCDLPVVVLKVGHFIPRKNPRIGPVPFPQFAIRGHVPADSAIKPDTSIEADLNDEIPI
jgi:hypothetical protein